MIRRLIPFLAVLAFCACYAGLSRAEAGRGVERRAGEEKDPAADHTAWIARSLREMETVKPGMTRAELQKVFREEGGLSNRKQRRYAYRECPYIKVDVKFEAVGATQDLLRESPRDRIVSVSTPFLERAIED